MFERGDRVLVDGMDGIIYWVRGYASIQLECQGHPADWDTPMGETFFCDGECEPESVDETMVVVTMVGDDRKYDVHTEDVSLLPDDEHVCSCGQRGCPHE